MKKYLLTFIAITALVTPMVAFAQEDTPDEDTNEINLISTNETEETEETEEDAPLFSFTSLVDGVETVMEDIQIFFTFDPEKKIEKRLEFAQERFDDMTVLMAEMEAGGATEEEITQVQERYERQIEHAIEIAKKHADKQDERLLKIQEIQDRHIAVLMAARDNVPAEENQSEAYESITKVINKTTAKYEVRNAERKALKQNKGNSNKGTEETIETE